MPVFYFTVDFMIKAMDIATPGRKGNLAGIGGGDKAESSAKASSNGNVDAK
jgi:phosphotransferase system  glucose/maltose/N-acetylglucosamine-specific IIC component